MLPLPTYKQNNRYPKNTEAVMSILSDYFMDLEKFHGDERY